MKAEYVWMMIFDVMGSLYSFLSVAEASAFCRFAG